MKHAERCCPERLYGKERYMRGCALPLVVRTKKEMQGNVTTMLQNGDLWMQIFLEVQTATNWATRRTRK